MAGKRIVYALMALVVLTLVSATAGMAEDKFVYTTEQDEPGSMVVLDWGTTTVLPNGHSQLRGFTWSVRNNVLERPEWSSTNTLVTNWNVDENGLGPMWGTYHRVFDNGLGVCDGNYSGQQTKDGYTARGASTHCEGLIKKQWKDDVNGIAHTRTMLDK